MEAPSGPAVPGGRQIVEAATVVEVPPRATSGVLAVGVAAEGTGRGPLA